MSYNLISFVFVVSTLCNIGHTRIAPEFIHPCSDTSTECLTKATQDAIQDFVKGLPHLGVPQLDPFTIEELALDLSALTITFHNGHISGLRTCIADKVTFSIEKRHFEIDFHCNLTLAGKYTAKGNLLSFQIDGDGDAKIDLTNIRLEIDVEWKLVKDDNNQKYFHINNYKLDVDYGDLVHFELTNLFKNSETLSNIIVAALNENWKIVVQEFGKPIVDTIAEFAINAIEKFFHGVPSHELLNVPLPDN